MKICYRAYAAAKPPILPTKHMHSLALPTMPQVPFNVGDEYASELSARPPTAQFSWPPPPENDNGAPTASPLYRPPPETQRIHAKTEVCATAVASMATASTLAAATTRQSVLQPQTQPHQPSRSAPELTAHNLREHNELSAESCSESYTSTCTTTTTTSDEYQRILFRSQSGQQQHNTALSAADSIDYATGADAEMATYPYGSFSSGTTDLMPFSQPSGRRSAQECAETLSHVVDTSQLVKYLKELTPAPQPAPLVFGSGNKKRVEFADSISRAVISPVPPVLPIEQSSIPNHPPKEWKSAMVQALTTASGESFHVAEQRAAVDLNTFNSAYNVKHVEPSKGEMLQPSTMPELSELAGFDSPYNRHDDDEPPVVPSQWAQQPLQSISSNITGTAVATKCALEQEVSDINAQHAFYENQIPKFKPQIYRKVISPYPTASDHHHACNQQNGAPCPHDEPAAGTILTQLLTTASPNPVQWAKQPPAEGPPPMQLPPPSTAYRPAPIDMRPQEKEDYGTKSPFLNALITAPFRSFTPFDHDVMTQLEDLPPQPAQPLHLLDALTVAPSTPVQNLQSEARAEYEFERLQQAERTRAEQMGTAVQQIITQSVNETQAERRRFSTSSSAFANVSGFRSVNPFTPMPKAMPYSSSNVDESTYSQNPQSDSYSIPSEAPQSAEPNQVAIAAAATKPHVSFPPPRPSVHTGLHEPSHIPKYQRQWFNLASQSPVRTPEPHELKENVPLAFVELPAAAAQQYSAPPPPPPQPQQLQPAVCQPPAPAPPAIAVTDTTDNINTNTNFELQHQTYADQPHRFEQFTDPGTATALQLKHRRSASPCRPHTPTSSLINKPAPTIPYYQQNLVAEECAAPTAHLYTDPRVDSPYFDRCPSPAPGPPPNPLRIHAPRVRTPEPLACSSLRQVAPGHQQPQVLRPGALAQTVQQSASHIYEQRPEVLEQRREADRTVQTRTRESQLNEEQRSDVATASCTQVGNTQVQRRTRVVEEFEHSQKAKSVEIRTQSSSSSACAAASGAARSICAGQSECAQQNGGFSCFKQSAGQQEKQHLLLREQDDESKDVARPLSKAGAPLGFVAREARRLSTNSQYTADLADYQSRFPTSSTITPSTTVSSQSKFPRKSFRPTADEPKAQSYDVRKTPVLGGAAASAGAQKCPPGYMQIQPNLKYTTRSALAQPPPITATNQGQHQQSQQSQQSSTISATQCSASKSAASTAAISSSSFSSSAQQQYANASAQQTQRQTSFPPPSPLPMLQQQASQISNPSNPLPLPSTAYKPTPPQSFTAPSVPQAPQPIPTTTTTQLPFTSNYNLSGGSTQKSANAAAVAATNTANKPSAVLSDPNPASAGNINNNFNANNTGGGAGTGGKGQKFGATSAPRRGRGVLNQASVGGRVPQCGCCNTQIRFEPLAVCVVFSLVLRVCIVSPLGTFLFPFRSKYICTCPYEKHVLF